MRPKPAKQKRPHALTRLRFELGGVSMREFADAIGCTHHQISTVESGQAKKLLIDRVGFRLRRAGVVDELVQPLLDGSAPDGLVESASLALLQTTRSIRTRHNDTRRGR